MAAPRTLPIYLGLGSVFAAIAARSFLLPLRAHELGVNRQEIGVLVASGVLVAAVLSVPSGFLADRWGKRRLVIGAVAAGLVSQLGLGLATSAPPMYLWQALGGLCAGAVQAALYSALIDIVPRERLGRAMGWLSLSLQLGFLAGPALAGLSQQFMNLQQALFATTALFAVALAMSFLTPAGRPNPNRSWDIWTPVRDLARLRQFWVATIGLLATTLAWGTQQAYLPLFAKEELHLPATQIGYMLAIQAVFNGLARIPGGRVVDSAPRKGGIVLVGGGVFAACLLVLPHLSGFWAPTILLAACVPFLATAYVALTVVYGNLSTEARGVAMGLYGTVLYLGLGLGPVAFGPILQNQGYVAGFTACALVSLALIAVMALLRMPLTARRREMALPPASPGT
jgi:MFS family permease